MSGFTKFGFLLSLLLIFGCSNQQETDGHDHGHGHDHSGDHSHDHADGHSHAQGMKQNPWNNLSQAHEDGHEHTPHLGVIAPFRSAQAQAGFAELKLHDDKGDLELWLTLDKAGTKPFDLLLDSVITVSFPKLKQEAVELRIRNNKNNEDEDGIGNIRSNKTNYFIFPGETGADASFLVGKDFVTEVTISFTADGATFTTAPFELRPHTH